MMLPKGKKVHHYDKTIRLRKQNRHKEPTIKIVASHISMLRVLIANVHFPRDRRTFVFSKNCSSLRQMHKHHEVRNERTYHI